MGRGLRGALAAAVLTSGTRGEPPIPPPSDVTATVSLQPSSWHTRRRATLEGTYGPNTSGRYVRIPGINGTPNVYAYCTNDRGDGVQVGIDPGPIVAALAGYTGVPVPLGTGNITAAARATAMRAALTTAGYYSSVGGSGGDVVIQGQIGSVTTGAIHGSAGGASGTRRATPQFSSSPLSGRVGQFMTWAGGSVRVNAIGIYLADTTTAVRIAMYTGGTQASLTGTTRVADVNIASGGAVGWNWSAVPTFTLANDNVRLVAKSNGSSIPGYIGSGDLTGTDFTADPLEIYSESASDPAVAWTSSLDVETVGSTSAVYVMMAFQWTAVDGTSGVFTTRVGVHIADPTDLAQQSSLTSPDAGGADLYMGAPNPGMLGMELHAWAIAHGTSHSTQMRAHLCNGGSVGDASGSTVLWQGLTAGSATDAFVEIAVPGNVAVPSTGVLQWGVRNNAGTATLRFALNANRETASPDDNVADFVDASEYEIFNSLDGAGVVPDQHETDPAVAVASPVSTDGAFTATNTNYPGAYFVLRVNADTAA